MSHPTNAVIKNHKEELIVKAQIDGPIIMVDHQTAQFFPNILVLSFPGVISEIIALSTDIFHQVIQSTILDRNIAITGIIANQNNSTFGRK